MSLSRIRHTQERIFPADGTLTQVTRGNAALDLEEVKDYLRVDNSVEDVQIERMIRGVQGELEPPNGWLGRALTTATYRLTLPDFASEIVLPAPPLQQVDSFQYRDTDGVLQTVDADLYRVTDDEPARIVEAYNTTWPTSSMDHGRIDSIVIEFTAGYGDSPDDVPEVIQDWMMYQIATRYDVRTGVLVGATAVPTPFVRNMLESWRVRI